MNGGVINKTRDRHSFYPARERERFVYARTRRSFIRSWVAHRHRKQQPSAIGNRRQLHGFHAPFGNNLGPANEPKMDEATADSITP